MSVNVGKLRIGEVHSLLRQDYPDIELSKIRYYEDKGLVRPDRSRKGYRLYSDRDVACLREAIRLAQEEFVPLRVVRVRLIEQGLLSDEPAVPALRQVARETAAHVVSIAVPPAPPAAPAPTKLTVVRTTDETVETDVPPAGDHLSRPEFEVVTGLDDLTVSKLELAGLLAPLRKGSELVFGPKDVRVAQCVEALLARGVDVRLLGALRRIVEREVGVIDDLTAPLRAPKSHVPSDQAHEVVAAVAGEVAALRSVLLERVLEDYLGE